MRIIISQQDKKILITLKSGKAVDNYAVDKADEFINVVDKFLKKRKIRPIGRMGPIRYIEPIGVLTERVIRAIMLGLSFNKR